MIGPTRLQSDNPSRSPRPTGGATRPDCGTRDLQKGLPNAGEMLCWGTPIIRLACRFEVRQGDSVTAVQIVRGRLRLGVCPEGFDDVIVSQPVPGRQSEQLHQRLLLCAVASDRRWAYLQPQRRNHPARRSESPLRPRFLPPQHLPASPSRVIRLCGETGGLSDASTTDVPRPSGSTAAAKIHEPPRQRRPQRIESSSASPSTAA